MPDPVTSPPPSTPRPLALCITDLDAGGAERALVQIARRLKALRGGTAWSPAVYCLGPEAELVDPLRNADMPVECFGATSARSRGAVRWLTAQLRSRPPVLLQSFLFHANIVARFAGRRAGVPVIVSGHRVAEQQKRWHLWLDRWTRGLVQQHVCVSQGVARHLHDRVRVPERKIAVIPNGVELPDPLPPPADLAAEFGIPREARVILAVGRLHRQKGFDRLLAAFEILLRQRDEDLRLVIVGEGPERKELESQAAKLGAGRVLLPGRREDILPLMLAAQCLAVTSRWEGMPNVVLEAMAAGLPIVAMDVEGIADLFGPQKSERARESKTVVAGAREARGFLDKSTRSTLPPAPSLKREGENSVDPRSTHHISGLIVPSGDVDRFAAEIARILDDQDFAAGLSHSAQAVCRTEFTWENVAAQYDRLYANLIR